MPAAQRVYALAALRREAIEVAGTEPGNQSNRLNEAARKIAEFVTAGVLSTEEVRQGLSAAARRWKYAPDREPWTTKEIHRVIESGLAAGLEHPPRDLSGIGTTVGADHQSDDRSGGQPNCDGSDGLNAPSGEPHPDPTPADGAGGGGAAAGGGGAAGIDDPPDGVEDDNDPSTDARRFVSFGPYRMNDSGLWFDPGNNSPQILLSRPFEVLAQTRDVNGSDWGLLLLWYDNDGHRHEWAMPKEALGGRREEVYRTFLREGLGIASSIEHRNKLADYLSSVPVLDRARCVSRVGWHSTPSGDLYVLPDQTIGGCDLNERMLLQTEHRIEMHYKVAGTVEDWRQMIGKRCIGQLETGYGSKRSVRGTTVRAYGRTEWWATFHRL